ncbi:MAG: glycosyl transferase [Rhodopirellula sp.]|nr:glycosyl transferase [Rhodopirellula sp.]
MLSLAIMSLAIACLPAVMFAKNLPAFLFPVASGTENGRDKDCSYDRKDTVDYGGVSVLIPARDEQDGIAASVNAALCSQGVDVEVLVLDDQSTDRTAEIVQRIAVADSRVRYLKGEDLPEGWNGKQFGCKQLSEAAEYETLVFLDADVRLKADALRRLVACYESLGVGLLSVFPLQETETLLEKWIIPLMHYVLLGYCPLHRMRTDLRPALAAGCGQLFVTKQNAYQKAGTHAAIRGSRHDGVKLPRAYREAGLMTDVYDGQELAECRMYHSAHEVIRGVLKNATEGLASLKLLFPFTVLLIGGSVLPVALVASSLALGDTVAAFVAGVAVLVGHFPRVFAALRLSQSWLGVLCHAPATLLFVLLQWIALLSHLAGRQVAWRGRTSS